MVGKPHRCWVSMVIGLVLLLPFVMFVSPTTATAPEGQPVHGGVLRLASQQNVLSLSPISVAGDPTYIMVANMYNRLTKYDADGKLVGSLAQSWTTSDSRTYVFHLIRGVKFHNGDAFTAEDVLYTIRLIQDPTSAATNAGIAREVESMSGPDPYTVRIVLKRPNVVFPNELTFPDMGIVDHQWRGDLKTQENGTGPFYLASREPNGTYVLKRFPPYWEQGKPYLDEIDYVPIINTTTRVNAVLTGQVDFAEYVQWNYYGVVRKDPKLRLYPGSYDYFNMIHLNVHQAPLTDVRVREALNYAVSRQQINQAAFGGLAKLITGDMLPGDTYYHSAALEGTYAYDPAKARHLLTEAGLKPEDLHLILTTFTAPVHYETAQIVQQQLTTFGAQVVLKEQTVQELIKNWYQGNYQMMMDGQQLPWGDPSVLGSYFMPGGVYDSSGIGFSDPEVSRLLSEGLEVSDAARRKAIYEQASRQILHDAPWIFLNFRVQGEATSVRVHGYVHLPGGLSALFSMGRMEDVWLDKTH